MTIRRRCTERNCKNGRKCLEHLRFDVMFRGKRYRIPANEFAIPRMEPGKQQPIKQEGTGGELEQQRPTASCAVRLKADTTTVKLIDLVSSTGCPRFVPGNWKIWLRGRATTGTCSCGAGRHNRVLGLLKSPPAMTSSSNRQRGGDCPGELWGAHPGDVWAIAASALCLIPWR
jgi:hypothetical protein